MPDLMPLEAKAARTELVSVMKSRLRTGKPHEPKKRWDTQEKADERRNARKVHDRPRQTHRVCKRHRARREVLETAYCRGEWSTRDGSRNDSSDRGAVRDLYDAHFMGI